MATGPEHYYLAEQLLADADVSDVIGQYDHAARLANRALGHAILAQAAAAALNDFDGGMGRVDHRAWLNVASADWCVKHQRVLDYDGKCRECADEQDAEQQAALDAEGAETVMSASERYEHDRADEFRIDAEDDARWGDAAQDGAPF